MRLHICDLRRDGVDRDGADRDGVDRDGAGRDVSLGPVAADVTVGELLDLLGGGRDGYGSIDLDGVAVSAQARLAELNLLAGSTLRVCDDAADTASERGLGGAVDAVVEVRQIAGAGSGLAVELGDGSFDLGPGPAPGLGYGRVSRPALRIEVIDPDLCLVSTEADGVRLDGRPLAAAAAEVPLDGAGHVVVAGVVAFRLARPSPGTSYPARSSAARSSAPGTGAARVRPAASIVDGTADPHGRLPLIRSPRVAIPAPASDVAVPAPVTPPPVPAPLSWLLLLAPLPIGVVMALVFSPFFLVMTAMTPMMALARWVESKFRAKKDTARVAMEEEAAATQFAADLDEVRASSGYAARAAYADLVELRERAASGHRLWEVRPGDQDELRVTLGVGSLPWRPELGRRGDGVAAMPYLARTLAERDRLIDVPLTVDLRERSGLGVIGAVEVARPALAAVLLDLVVRHGPADLDLAMVIDPASVSWWDWAKWLPHLAGEGGAPRIATDAEAAVRLLTRLDADAAAPTGGSIRSTTSPSGHLVVVVDGDDLLTGQLASLLGRLARGRGRALVLASRPQRLPSVCRSFVELDLDGLATLTDAVTGDRVDGLIAVRAAADVGAGIARALARWTDPEQPAAAVNLPDRARLLDLLLTAVREPDGLGRPVDELDPDTIAAWWRRGTDGLRATIAVTDHGPLTVDLLADGPHGLVVGTTGAGKSELLRTLVMSLACRYSPDDLTFLLVDFKGGGAFDACAGLPHTVGVVTDLDEHLAARALRCLRAELRYRERRLREAGVSDLSDWLAPSPPLPRLVIVIDEFATLAMELPGFLSALIDVAQRGRSLGIHLLLATQRPQGVVDGKIRANTNLRIALRVQDDADSRDVLGTRHAADIDRRRPGRAFVRFGAGEVVAVQTALVSAAVSQEAVRRIEVGAFDLVPPPVAGTSDAVASGPTDLAQLSVATVAAARQDGYPKPRVPWPAPLPAEVDAWTLPTPPSDPDTPVPVPLAIVDLPDEQRRGVWCWRPEAGGTAVLAAGADAAATVLAAACLGLSRHRSPDQQQIFVLDGLGRGLSDLIGLPHVVAVVGVDDTERLGRVLDLLDTEVARRRASAEPGPDILLVLAGWSAVVESAERAGLLDVAQRLERLLRDGVTAGVRLLVSAPHERAIPGRVFAQLATKLCLRLADPSSYTGLGLRPRDLPDLRGLRAIDLRDQHELQIARYDRDAVDRVASQYPDAVRADAVVVLPEIVPLTEVLDVSAMVASTWRLGVGRYFGDLRVASLALAPGMHAVVAGPPGSGRTTALRVLAAAARASVAGSTICVVTANPAAWEPATVTELVNSFDELSCWPPPGPGLLLVDGVDTMGPGVAPALDRLVTNVPVGAHIVISGRGEAFRGMQAWQRAVTLSRSGLLLRPGLDDGDVLRIRLPRDGMPRPLPGRGFLVEAGGLAQVQTAYLPEPAAVQV